MTAAATLEDLRDLRNLVDGWPYDDNQRERLLGHIDTTIRVREAQKGRSRTDWHRERQEAFDAALARWWAECEQACIGHATEIADFRRDHPMPSLTDFYRSDRPGNVCPTCGSVLGDV